MSNLTPSLVSSRRSFLKKSVFGLIPVAALPFTFWPVTARAAQMLHSSLLSTHIAPSSRIADLQIQLRSYPRAIQLFPDNMTDVWSYEMTVTTGDLKRVQSTGNGFLGPQLEVRKGERISIEYRNDIPDESIVHWHGLDVPADQDGHPHQTVPANGIFNYNFTIKNRAGLYFFHPHPHGKLGEQINRGLVGVLIVRDDEEDALNLPSGVDEHLLCVQDRRVNANRQFEYLTGGMHDRMMGMHGNELFLNGERNRKKMVRRGSQRLRILNGSNARIYNLMWSDGRPLTVIGTDGGLLEKPMTTTSLLLAPSERLDLLVDLTDLAVGSTLSLQSAPSQGATGKPFDIATFEATAEVGVTYQTPLSLSKFDLIPATEAVNFTAPKSFQLIPTRDHGWTIDGQPYDMHGASTKETVRFGDTEIWEFDNTLANMPHPIHIHGTQFQVLSRKSGGVSGAMDNGWKDTVLVMPGDKVSVIKRFNTERGIFVYHCHNLEHEDMSMMRNFIIQ